MLFRSSKDLVASKEGQFGKFDNNSSETVELALAGTYYDTDLSKSTIYLHFGPNGHDNWNFNFDIVITWQDGTQSISNLKGLNLSHEKTDLETIVFN